MRSFSIKVVAAILAVGFISNAYGQHTDIEIEVKEETLTVSGKQAQDTEERDYLYQGIAARAFERRFRLADHVQVSGARLENGLLHVDLVREIPEALKPRRIEISSGKVIESKAKAA